MTIDSDSSEFRNAMDFSIFTDRYGIVAEAWPSEEYFSFLALAQHHGVPTRLMDWTRSSMVGAYFAAAQYLSLNEHPDKIALWIIDSEKIAQLNGALEFIKLPGSVSNNLAAQKGVFLVHRSKNGISRNNKFCVNGHENAVNGILEKSNCLGSVKITLPGELAGDLLIRCTKFGVSAASLFPGFDGVAKAALEFKQAKKLAGRL